MTNDPSLTKPSASDSLAILYPDDVPKLAAPHKVTPAPSGQPSGAAEEPREVILYPEDPTEDVRHLEAPHGAPDRSYSLQMPEGLAMTKEIMAEVEPVFRELNLSDAGARRLMPLASKFHERILDGMADEAENMRAGWARQVAKDPELGGSNWSQTQSAISRALEAAGASQGSPFVNLLEESGLGNHPEMVRALKNIGLKL